MSKNTFTHTQILLGIWNFVEKWIIQIVISLVGLGIITIISLYYTSKVHARDIETLKENSVEKKVYDAHQSAMFDQIFAVREDQKELKDDLKVIHEDIKTILKEQR